MRKWGVLAVAAFVVAGGAVAAWWVLVGEPQARQRAAVETVEAYASAWEAGDWAALGARVRPPSQPAVDGHRALVLDLDPEEFRVEPTALALEDDSAAAQLDIAATLPGLEPWSWTTTLELVWADGTWQVAWTPAAVHPDFVEGGRFRRSRTLEPRAAIRDRHGEALVGGTAVVAVGIEPQRIVDEDDVVEALVAHAGASRLEVAALLARDDLVDDWFYPVVELPRERFEEVDAQLRPVSGILFRAAEGRAGPPGGFALHVLGRAEELTAEQAEELGQGHEEGDLAGVFGLERALNEQLAGRPETVVSVVDPGGELVADVHRVGGEPPADVTITLDRRVQRAAEEALGGVDQPAALVAVDLPTVEVLAAVSRPVEGFNRALEGRYPPGSTFKVVTTAALLGEGHDAAATLDCPAERNVGGRAFRNAGGMALGTITLETAFTESCNTAYVGVMPGAEEPLAAAARAFGFDETGHEVAVSAFGGSYPEPGDLVEAAAAAIGQARVEASPLHMATVAAAAASGQWRPATLVPDAAGPREPREVPGDAEVMRALMYEVVASGTGTAAQVPGEPVGGKTGSAEFGAGDPPDTHAWFIGFRGALAFAVLVEGGGAGGEVAAPIAAQFLAALD